MTLTVTLTGDFADPLSYLASQRITRLSSLSILDVHWCAVTVQPRLPRASAPLTEAGALTAATAALPGELLPAAGTLVPSSGAASAAYAEALTESLADPTADRPRIADRIRAALFDALWVQHRRIDDPEVIRHVVFDVFDAGYERADIRRRIASNDSLLPHHGSHPLGASRRSGYVVTLAGAPMTTDGQRRLDTWQQAWRDRGEPDLPTLNTSQGEQLTGLGALRWLEQLLLPVTSTQPLPAARDGRPATSVVTGSAPASQR